jgi:hypothetical protein
MPRVCIPVFEELNTIIQTKCDNEKILDQWNEESKKFAELVKELHSKNNNTPEYEEFMENTLWEKLWFVYDNIILYIDYTSEYREDFINTFFGNKEPPDAVRVEKEQDSNITYPYTDQYGEVWATPTLTMDDYLYLKEEMEEERMLAHMERAASRNEERRCRY